MPLPALPSQNVRHVIAEAVHQAIACQVGGHGNSLCAAYAAVGSLVLSECYDRVCYPVAGGLILQGKANLLHHWIPASADFAASGNYHCWIEIPTEHSDRRVHVDFTSRHDTAYVGRKFLRKQSRMIWGWADEVRISLHDFARTGHIPAGHTLVLPDYPAATLWLMSYMVDHQRAIAHLAGKALAKLDVSQLHAG